MGLPVKTHYYLPISNRYGSTKKGLREHHHMEASGVVQPVEMFFFFQRFFGAVSKAFSFIPSLKLT